MRMIQGDTSGGDNALAGRVWVTRAGVHVDRIASAWLIRRFIDPDARFKFVPAKGYVPEPGELRFDMRGGRLRRDTVSLWISGASADCYGVVPLAGRCAGRA
jgi:hypothetical protein